MCFKNMTEGENIEVLMYYEDIVQNPLNHKSKIILRSIYLY